MGQEEGLKLSEKTPIKVYWAPAQFTEADSQWNFLYSEPKPVADSLIENTTKDTILVKCPATRDALKNVYSLQSNFEDNVDLSNLDLKMAESDPTNNQYQLPVESKVSLTRVRRSSYKNYANIRYNLGWLLFSDEPLTVRLTSPYFPSSTPAEGSILAVGEFDIGQWYRPINLDYHIPVDAQSFRIKEDQSLAFLEFKTDRPINFQRYTLSPVLNNLVEEFVNSPDRYGKRKTLLERYRMAKKANAADIVLKEIKKNTI